MSIQGLPISNQRRRTILKSRDRLKSAWIQNQVAFHCDTVVRLPIGFVVGHSTTGYGMLYALYFILPRIANFKTGRELYSHLSFKLHA